MAQENHFSKIMYDLTESELMNYIENKSEFQEDAVLAAIWELEKRDKGGIKVIELKTQIENKNITKLNKTEIAKKESNITKDPNAPQLFHPKFIMVFGVLFSVLAGGILMALNFSRIGNKRNAWLTVLASFIYSTIQVILLSYIGPNTYGLTVAINLLGISLLENLFWKRLVPKDLKYRKRNIWGALIIALVIYTPIIILNIMALQYE